MPWYKLTLQRPKIMGCVKRVSPKYYLCFALDSWASRRCNMGVEYSRALERGFLETFCAATTVASDGVSVTSVDSSHSRSSLLLNLLLVEKGRTRVNQQSKRVREFASVTEGHRLTGTVGICLSPCAEKPTAARLETFPVRS